MLNYLFRLLKTYCTKKEIVRFAKNLTKTRINVVYLPHVLRILEFIILKTQKMITVN